MSLQTAVPAGLLDRFMSNALALSAGLLFGAGLTLSHMIDPAKVIGFLDLFGQWDPSLAFVMVAAVSVTFFGYRLARVQGRPWVAPTFVEPRRKSLDPRLIFGAVLFGLGWGLAGYCPGPAIAGLALAQPPTLIFVVAMLAGMLLYRVTLEARS